MQIKFFLEGESPTLRHLISIMPQFFLLRSSYLCSLLFYSYSVILILLSLVLFIFSYLFSDLSRFIHIQLSHLHYVLFYLYFIFFIFCLVFSFHIQLILVIFSHPLSIQSHLSTDILYSVSIHLINFRLPYLYFVLSYLYSFFLFIFTLILI